MGVQQKENNAANLQTEQYRIQPLYAQFGGNGKWDQTVTTSASLLNFLEI